MTEFGHTIAIGDDFVMDTWGAGPFIIHVAGKSYRFEDSDMFGPSLLTKADEPRKNPWPAERSPFWRAHRIWRRQGRRVDSDQVTCVWEEPKPMTYCVIGRTKFVVDPGEEDGLIIRVPTTPEFVSKITERTSAT